MNTVRIAVITACVAAGASSYLSLRGAATHDAQSPQSTRTPTTHSAAGAHQSVGSSRQRALEPRARDTVTEPASEPDAIPQSPTLDELLEALNAALGPEGEPVDREALAALLRDDPELARMLRD